MAIDEKKRQKKLAKKAADRKAKEAERRSLITAGSSAAVARFPIGDCFIPTDLFSEGIGHLVLTRTLPNGRIAVAGFLIDVFCVGVKNALYREISYEEYASYLEDVESRAPMEKAHPSCLRKLVEGAARYAQDIGFSPHPDYAKASRLFGDIDAAACPVRYTFGKDGKPFYINGSYETPAQQSKIIETLERHLGSDGFEHMYMIGDGADEFAPASMAGNLKLVNYRISDDIPADSPFAKLPASVQKEFNELYALVFKNPQQAIGRIKSLIEQYPDVPQPYNYLHSAYRLLNDEVSADRILQETLERFPDYLFARIAQANDCLDRGAIDRIAEIFDGKFELSLACPGREYYHSSEVLHFSAIMARYFYAKGEGNKAEVYYKLMKQLDPTHNTTQIVDRIIHPKSNKAIDWLRKLVGKAGSS